MARPKLTALRAPTPDLFIGDLPAREVAPGPPDHACAVCGVFGASFGFKPPGWVHNRAEAVWACSDTECRTEARAKAVAPAREAV